MKKISLFLVAALLFGIGSAFTTGKSATPTLAYGYDGTWHQVNTDDIGVTFRCDTGIDYCLYGSENTSDPLPGQTQDKQFVLIP